MRTESRARITGGIPYLVILVPLLTLGPLAVLSVDPHHDGAMLPAALVVRDGGRVFADISSAYGFLLPMLQGSWIGVVFRDSPVLSLRVLELLTITLSAWALVLVGSSRRTSPWPIRRSSAAFSALVWILAADHFNGRLPFLPSSGGLASLAVVLVLVVARLAAETPREGSRRRGFLLIVMGALIACVGLLRPQVFAVLVALCIAVTLVFLRRNTVVPVLEGGRTVAVSASIVLLAAVAPLIWDGRWTAYLTQSVAAPFTRFTVGESGGSNLMGVLGLLQPYLYWCLESGPLLVFISSWFVLLSHGVARHVRVLAGAGLFLGFGASAVLQRVSMKGIIAQLAGTSPAGELLVTASAAIFLLFGVALLLRSLSRRSGLQDARPGSPLFRPTVLGLGTGALAIPVGLADLRATVLVLFVLTVLTVSDSALRNWLDPNRSFAWFLLVALALAGVAESVASASARNIWIGLPLVVMTIVVGIERLPHAASFGKAALIAFVGFSAIIASLGNLRAARDDASQFADLHVARGINGVRPGFGTVEDYEFLNRLLESDRNAGRRVIFHVNDALLSISAQQYVGADGFYARWIPGPDLFGRAEMADVVVLQGVQRESESERLSGVGFVERNRILDVVVLARPMEPELTRQ